MNIKTKIRAAMAIALGSTLAFAQATTAQRPVIGTLTTGTVLSIEYTDGDRCNIILNVAEGQTTTEVTDALTCDGILVGNRIQFVREVVQLEVLPALETGTVTRVERGDRTCYVGLTDANNNTFVQFADFSICEQNLEGATVRLTYGPAEVLARSCQGDVDCGQTESATIITEAEVINRPTATEQPEPDQPKVGSLPDGNYRYWNGAPTDGIVSDDDLLASGDRTLVVTFRKRGNNFTGTFGYVNDDTICVQGQANGDTVTGISVQAAPGIEPISTGEMFVSFNVGDRLMLRRGRALGSRTQTTNGTQYTLNDVRYDSTLLNLEGLNRINAGSRVPPSRC